MWVIGILYKKGVADPLGNSTLGDIKDLGISSIGSVRTTRLYFISGSVGEKDIEKVCKELLVDGQIQEYSYAQEDTKKLVGAEGNSNAWAVEVRLKRGVTDAVGKSVEKGIKIIGIKGIDEVNTGTVYILEGNPTEGELGNICRRILANPIIQDYSYRKVGA